MKEQNRISQLTLELYRRGLATNKERRQVEKALETDIEIRKQYEELQKSDREMRLHVKRELERLNVSEIPSHPSPRKRKILISLIAAAFLLCALVSAFFFLNIDGSNNDKAIAEETAPEITGNEPVTEIAEPSEPQLRMERESTDDRTAITETPRAENRTTEPETRLDPSSGVSIVTAPVPDTGVRTRGGDLVGGQSETPAAPEEPSNINIPPGLSSIFENMFANRDLTFVIIPSRITSIGRNAFSGNPLLSVTIGADVTIADNAIPGNFAAAYNANGKTAGTYTRSDVNSEAWGKR